MKLSAPLLSIVVVLTSGCAAGWSLGAGPTVDTDGNVGLLVTGRMGLGLGLGDDTGFTIGLEGGVGPALDDAKGVAIGMSALDVFHFEDDLMWRVGMRGGWMGRFDDRRLESLVVVGGAVAIVSYETKHRSYGGKGGGRSRTARGFGGELRVLAGLPFVEEGERPVRTIFGLSFLWEMNGISRFF